MTATSKTLKDDAMVLVQLRNDFYRTKCHFSLGLFLLSLVGIVALAWMLVYLVKHPTAPVYFPADNLGRLMQEVPLTQPNMTNDQVAAWAVNAVEIAYSYDFINYHGELQNAQKYFTEYGWSNYMKGLTASNNLLALTQRKYIINAKVVAQPKLLNQGIVGGLLAWKFEMPVLVTYLSPPFNDKNQFSNPLLVTVIVQRQNLLESYGGLALLQLNAKLAVSA